uniref:heme oxygenase (biliverdin-producing) n=1 Tax=Storeatula sp. CCMP1868 TaxID=195070 RepID=A0A222AHU6_9CRYP|nr:heme oxygenase [Storeatula sp. CCMP1868]
MVSNLATQLREGTSKAHSMAENVSFVKSFLGGVIDKDSYKKMVSNLYFVYVAIEDAMEENRTHECIEPIFYQELNRRESLEQDLEFYYGENWKDTISPSPATEAYVDRIRTIGENKPELLVAHAYTRYLGDLSGGQILKKIAQRAMNLKDNRGLAFYDFTEIQDEQSFKQNYKTALDNLPIPADETGKIIAEANVSFNLNMKMFQELEASFIKIFASVIINSIKSSIESFSPKKQEIA